MALACDTNPDRVALFRAFDEALPSIDFECGRTLLGELSEAGLINTAADLCVDVVEGATPLAEWEQLSIRALTDEVLSAGTATAEQIDACLSELDDPDYRGLGWAWIGVRGQRPTGLRQRGHAS